jgi:hypothetical protein
VGVLQGAVLSSSKWYLLSESNMGEQHLLKEEDNACVQAICLLLPVKQLFLFRLPTKILKRRLETQTK